jgi:cytochrome c oxidase accessory protein FixG
MKTSHTATQKPVEPEKTESNVSATNNRLQDPQLDELYHELHINTGGETIHAKRAPGPFRRIKWYTASIWLLFFLGPYLRWEGKQAVMFDIPGRQFHIFNITVLPQDVWLLALVLLFFAMLLAAVTSIAGRVFCGYFCFQTVWTDIFTWIEEKLEGQPLQRRKLDKAPWTFKKLRIKTIKHTAWMLISIFTGISFTLWFANAPSLWMEYLTLQAPLFAWVTVGTFTFFTYTFAGFMREQVCFWLCPYARIQGVMYDRETILPTYDTARGEPRGKLKKITTDGGTKLGDCIDCKQCVAVCPTGVDIREGQQEGCITCGLCIDACDDIMDKVNRPRGLIRYASLDEMEGKQKISLGKRPGVLVYLAIVLSSIAGIIYGLNTLGALELKVLHERQPLFVMQSDGSIQNKYVLKILNKTDAEMQVKVSASGFPDLILKGAENSLKLTNGRISAYTVYLRIPNAKLRQDTLPVFFHVQDIAQPKHVVEYKSMFFGPKK